MEHHHFFLGEIVEITIFRWVFPWPAAGVVHEPRGAAAAGGEAPGGAQRGAETGGAGPPELRGGETGTVGKLAEDEDFGGFWKGLKYR